MRRVSGAAAAVVLSSLAIAGCGGGGDAGETPPAATAPITAAAPVAVTAVGLGEKVSPGPNTPAPVSKALAGSGVVVVSFVVKGAADDDSVAAAISEVRSDPRVATGVAFFEYTVGGAKPGDLADLLGITGTPSVAVIGRDRTLVNLWTGLVDADILRQSISDASDTAASNPGKAASGTSAPSASGPTGNPAGIALAKRVTAAAADIAGVKTSGSIPVRGAGVMTIDATIALEGGKVTGMSGRFSIAEVSFEMFMSPSVTRMRSAEASCWAELPQGAGAFSAADSAAPTVSLAGARFGKPRTEGDTQLLDVTSGGTTVTYVVDTATAAVTELRTEGGTLGFTALETAPEIDEASPVCDNPADALKGLPASVGGTS